MASKAMISFTVYGCDEIGWLGMTAGVLKHGLGRSLLGWVVCLYCEEADSLIWTVFSRLQIQGADFARADLSFLDSTSAIHSNHSPFTLDFSPIYKPCHSRKSINRAPISLEKGPKLEGIKREIGDRSCLLAPPRPPLEFCRTTAGPPPEGLTPDILPDHHQRPNVLPDHHLKARCSAGPPPEGPTFCRTTTKGPTFCRTTTRGLTFRQTSTKGPTFYRITTRRPDVLPDHHLRPDILPDHHQKPDVLPDNHLTPDVLPNHHQRPDILPDHH
ncbi:hypothetical protein M5K25_022880 [Dendrobium thyrsiflorum]|uniref:Uncharacterized protein n=1 Tax=Dendrobium thyrsiflorum TaxID=117978 RepID=A0ABD0U6U5_DENTH